LIENAEISRECQAKKNIISAVREMTFGISYQAPNLAHISSFGTICRMQQRPYTVDFY